LTEFVDEFVIGELFKPESWKRIEIKRPLQMISKGEKRPDVLPESLTDVIDRNTLYCPEMAS